MKCPLYNSPVPPLRSSFSWAHDQGASVACWGCDNQEAAEQVSTGSEGTCEFVESSSNSEAARDIEESPASRCTGRGERPLQQYIESCHTCTTACLRRSVAKQTETLSSQTVEKDGSGIRSLRQSQREGEEAMQTKHHRLTCSLPGSIGVTASRTRLRRMCGRMTLRQRRPSNSSCFSILN